MRTLGKPFLGYGGIHDIGSCCAMILRRENAVRSSGSFRKHQSWSAEPGTIRNYLLLRNVWTLFTVRQWRINAKREADSSFPFWEVWFSFFIYCYGYDKVADLLTKNSWKYYQLSLSPTWWYFLHGTVLPLVLAKLCLRLSGMEKRSCLKILKKKSFNFKINRIKHLYSRICIQSRSGLHGDWRPDRVIERFRIFSSGASQTVECIIRIWGG
jgi:hypothetical protein